MTVNARILLDGSYQYTQNSLQYSQENFKLVYYPETGHHKIFAEILSRVETGELLKLNIQYELNTNLFPVYSKIEKSLGKKYSLETFEFDPLQQELQYVFQNNTMTQNFRQSLSSKHYLTTPAVCTASLFTLTKKFDTTNRTAVAFIKSINDWDYVGAPKEEVLYADYNNREVGDFQINKTDLSATQLKIYSSDLPQANTADMYLSKHFNIPYQLEQGDLKMVIKHLKKLD